MLAYTLNHKQVDILEGMAYRRADIEYIKKRFAPLDRESEHALKTSRLTLDTLINEADREKIPLWVQNIILCDYENINLWFSTSVLSHLMSKKGYCIDYRA